MELKETNGVFYRAVREDHGLFGLQAVTIEKGKVTKVDTVDANYPPVMKDKLVKFAFGQAMADFDEKVKT